MEGRRALRGDPNPTPRAPGARSEGRPASWEGVSRPPPHGRQADTPMPPPPPPPSRSSRGSHPGRRCACRCTIATWLLGASRERREGQPAAGAAARSRPALARRCRAAPRPAACAAACRWALVCRLRQPHPWLLWRASLPDQLGTPCSGGPWCSLTAACARRLPCPPSCQPASLQLPHSLRCLRNHTIQQAAHRSMKRPRAFPDRCPARTLLASHHRPPAAPGVACCRLLRLQPWAWYCTANCAVHRKAPLPSCCCCSRQPLPARSHMPGGLWLGAAPSCGGLPSSKSGWEGRQEAHEP